MKNDQPQRFGPLKDVRVIDLTAMVFGPYATQIMADMGADVIKIEQPGGDDTRYINAGPTPDLGAIYVNCNRGKRSVVLDLREEAGKAALRELIEGADVFIHSMRGKAIARLGFDYAAVSAIKPDIVYTNCYGYSRRGPYADKPAYDDTIQAECGIPYVQQLMNGEPGFVATILADKVAGLTALYATTMALFHRERTGEGQEVEVGMFETMASFMLVEHAGGAMFDPPIGPAHYHRVANRHRKPYPTKDGHVAALVYNDRHWRAFIEAIKPGWVTPDMDTLAGRAKQIDRIYQLLAKTFLTRTTAEWLALLTELNIPAAPLRTTDELFDDTHLKEIGFFEEVDSPEGTIRFPGVPTWFSKTPGKVAGPTARLGQDTEAVLGGLSQQG
jgi:crotonobetainyl-CoA:carnitine CoA-transferase CaiB-like acyl-CoA transferase